MKIVKNTTHKIERKGFSLVSFLPYIYIFPVFALLIIFTLNPFIYSIIKSFYNYDGILLNEFVGLGNYYKMFFKDQVFWIANLNMITYVIGFMLAFSFQVMAAELVFNLKNVKHQKSVRTLLILPIVVPLVVTVLVWKFMYYPSIGVFSTIFKNFGIMNFNPLGSEQFVKVALILIGFPWVSGLGFLIMFAGLQGIDHSILEASKIDGANIFQRITRIDLHIIMPQIKAVFVLGIIGLVQDYEKIFILTQGGPNFSSTVPGLHMYNVAFGVGSSSQQFGYSCAMGTLYFAITLIATTIFYRRKKEDH